MTPQYQSRLPL